MPARRLPPAAWTDGAMKRIDLRAVCAANAILICPLVQRAQEK
jgi:hypothetical protein